MRDEIRCFGNAKNLLKGGTSEAVFSQFIMKNKGIKFLLADVEKGKRKKYDTFDSNYYRYVINGMDENAQLSIKKLIDACTKGRIRIENSSIKLADFNLSVYHN